MTLGAVLIHGGCHTAACWNRLSEKLSIPSIAPDLPGRGADATPLRDVTLQMCVRTVVDAVDTAGFDRVIIVGHSLGGITAAATAAALKERVAHLVLVAAVVPAEGECLLDNVSMLTRRIVHWALRGPILRAPPPWLVRMLFCNDMDAELAAETVAGIVPDAAELLRSRVTQTELAPTPRTYICTLRDRVLTPGVQLRQIANLGGARTHTLLAGHNAIMSRADDIAALIGQIAPPSSSIGH
jgi:pimeloyl-ACP methyl ester carboxylesterase